MTSSSPDKSADAIPPANGNKFVSSSKSQLMEADFDLLVFCPVPLTRNQLLVDFSSAYDRQPHPDPQLEQAIEKIWEQRAAAQPSLFNGTKFRRSADVGEYPGTLVFPGGHPEPEEAGILSHSESDKTTKEELENRIAEEMFEGITREVVEETGIPSTALSDPVYIGCARRKQNVRPAAFFYVKSSLTSDQVLHSYQHAEHFYESTALYTVTPDALIEAAKRMPGCHQGGAALYQLMREEVLKQST